MLDIKFVRENPEIVKQNIKNKFQDEKLTLVDEVIALDEQARKTQQEADDLRAKKNKIYEVNTQDDLNKRYLVKDKKEVLIDKNNIKIKDNMLLKIKDNKVVEIIFDNDVQTRLK